ADVATRLAWPMFLIERVLALPVVLLGRSIRGITRLLVGAPQVLAERHRDFSRLIDLSHRKGVLADKQRTLLHEVIGFSSLRVRDVMVPRVDVAAVDVDAPRSAVLEEIRARSVSRLVACRGDLHPVTGPGSAPR